MNTNSTPTPPAQHPACMKCGVQIYQGVLCANCHSLATPQSVSSAGTGEAQPIIPRPRIGAFVISNAVNALNGGPIEVVAHTARGFKYRSALPLSIPRMGIQGDGTGEIFCDHPSVTWRYAATPPKMNAGETPADNTHQPGAITNNPLLKDPATGRIFRLSDPSPTDGTTPRSDAFFAEYDDRHPITDRTKDFIRTLELELNAAKADYENRIHSLKAERTADIKQIDQLAARLAEVEKELSLREDASNIQDTEAYKTARLLDDWAAKLAAAEATLVQAKQQLPEEMQDCTIVFKECEKGHGWLTATNWVQHGCPWCERNSLRAANTALQEASSLAINILDGNADPIDWRTGGHCELLRKLCEHLEAYEARGSEIDALSAQVEELRKDGERLDWLENQDVQIFDAYHERADKPTISYDGSGIVGSVLRQAIDAVRATPPGQKEGT